MPWASTSTPPPRRAARAGTAPPRAVLAVGGLEEGKAVEWSQCRCVSRIVPAKESPPKSALARRIPVPESKISLGDSGVVMGYRDAGGVAAVSNEALAGRGRRTSHP